PVDELLHTGNSGLIIHRVGQVNYRFRRQARSFARDLQDGTNKALHPYATTLVYEELFGVQDRVDIVTGTLGKALGGASGGYTSGRAEIVEMLRQRSRPYLFSNSLAPAVTAAAIAALDLLSTSGELLTRLRENTALFRSRMTEAGFDLLPGEHPIIPVMIGDAAEAGRMADLLLERGVYVIGFSYPVVPHGKARIRTQMSAAHSTDDVNRAVDAFIAARDAM
ncbi:aminotransferase class I/II-fold pyridoxal phosphate-dependent enzyme, partial [Saccharothrix sp. MB29]|nr:aminotransferase class I/II-fold pyridoxal phosphate-dependent enzyme [Saccharothrix sp. MB29]